MTAYVAWKLIHILSATVLFGTGAGIAFFAWFGYRRAIRTDDIGGLRMVLRLTVVADAVFTAPAVVMQLVSGLALMHLNSWSWGSPWFQASIALFVLVGACWLPVVVIQIKLSREAHRAEGVSDLGDDFHRRFRRWFVLGVPAFLMVLILFYLMVAKPLPVL